MIGWKKLLVAVMFVVGVSVAIGVVWAGVGDDSSISANTEVLIKEIRELRDDIKLLRYEIQELREEMLAKQPVRQGKLPERGRGPSEAESSKTVKGARVIFTKVAREGPGGTGARGNVEGRVEGIAEPEKYRVVLYAFTDKWYVQPTEANPYTSIREDGSWSNWTHLGKRYAGLLVRPSFQPRSTLQMLPSVGGDVIGVAVRNGK